MRRRPVHSGLEQITLDDAYAILAAIMGGDPVPSNVLGKLQAMALHREQQIWIAALYERNRHKKGVGKIVAGMTGKSASSVYRTWQDFRHSLPQKPEV